MDQCVITRVASEAHADLARLIQKHRKQTSLLLATLLGLYLGTHKTLTWSPRWRALTPRGVLLIATVISKRTAGHVLH